MEELPDENLLTVQEKLWFVDIAYYKATSLIHNDLNGKQTKSILVIQINVFGMTRTCSKLEWIIY